MNGRRRATRYSGKRQIYSAKERALMKISPGRARASSIAIVTLSLIAAAPVCAATYNAQDEALKIVKQDSGAKAQIVAAKQKIAEEREGILAASRKLSQVKKTGDKAAIEQAKREVDADIKERKNAISVLKTEIERLQGAAESFAPRSKDALER